MNKRPLYAELSLYMIGIAVLAAIMFTWLTINFNEKGFDDSFEILLLVEAIQYEEQYYENKNTPLPQSNTLRGFLNDWQGAPQYYLDNISLNDLVINEYTIIDEGYDDDSFFGRISSWSGEFDSRFLIILPYQLFDGKILYLVADIQEGLLSKDDVDESNIIGRSIYYPAGVFVFIMIFLMWLLNRRYAKQINHLALWSDNLALNNLPEQAPNFRYSDLVGIGDKLLNAFQRYAKATQNERQFLRNASHELRTPIAIIRANVELLERQSLPTTPQKQLARISRASQNIQLLTETLLWLGRENETLPNFSHVSLIKIIEESISDFSYLIKEKNININQCYIKEEKWAKLPETPLKIIIGNLIRNAFQHSHEGQIYIQLEETRFIIKNDQENSADGKTDDNFGLGLLLVRQICDRLGWQLTLDVNPDSVCAVLELNFDMSSSMSRNGSDSN